MMPALKPIWIAPALLAATAGVAIWQGDMFGIGTLSHMNSEEIGEHMAAVYDKPLAPSEGERLIIAASGAGAPHSDHIENGSAVAFSAVQDDESHGHAASGKNEPPAPPKKLTEDEKQVSYLETMKILPYEELTLPVADNFKLYARLYDPSQPIESDEEDEDEESDEEDASTEDEELEEEDPPVYKYPLVILMHGLNGSHQDWSAMPIRLVEKGYAVLSVDLRGHGLHTYKGWRHFSALDWENIPKDMPMLMRDIVAKRQEDFPQMDTDRVSVIGAGLGANVAIHAAQRAEHHVQALVVMSPSINYKGMDQVRALHRYENPVFFVASQNDVGPFEDTKILFRLARGKRALELYRALGHGTDMIRFYPELQAKIVDWIAGYVPPHKILVPPEVDDEDEEDDGGDEHGHHG